MTVAKRKFWPLAPTAQLVLGGALLGAVAFVLLYGFAPINPFDDTWLRGGYVERDTVQHYTGWLFYRASPWRFPIGVAQNFNYPTGGYVGLADAIPLFAVLFKLLSPVLPATFQYFGLWAFLCSVLQGAAAALLLSLFTQNKLHNWLLCGLFVTAPILLDRQLRHGALGAQFFVLFALYLYFKHRRSLRFFSPGFVALCALSITVHPYFVPMVFAVLFALLVENAIYARRWWQPLASLGLCLAATLVTGWVFGMFHSATDGGGTMFGYFSMNLNALYNPISWDTKWSLVLPVQNQTLGNYDGFNYLGLGVLATGAVALADAVVSAVRRGRGRDKGKGLKGWPVWALVKRHFGLLFACLCLAVFAVSSTVTANGRVWFTLPLPQAVLDLAGTLRSSGRMFYPVWYLLLLGACLYWLRRPPVKWRQATVIAFAAVQLVDISPGLWDKATSFRPYQPVVQTGLESGFWGAVAGEYAHMASLDGTPLLQPIDMAEYAATNGMTTTDAFTARFDITQHDAQVSQAWQELEAGTPRGDTLYITSQEKNFVQLAKLLDGEMYCAMVDEKWYVLAPYTAGFTGYAPGADEALVRFEDYPLLIADYTDALWVNGVLSTDKRVVCFVDNDFTREHIDGMAAFEANGQTYPVLDVSYKDEGWIIVTLDIADADVLKGVPLEGLP